MSCCTACTHFHFWFFNGFGLIFTFLGNTVISMSEYSLLLLLAPSSWFEESLFWFLVLLFRPSVFYLLLLFLTILLLDNLTVAVSKY